jgi:hypothetical protein
MGRAGKHGSQYVSLDLPRVEETLLTATNSHSGSLADGAESRTSSPGHTWGRGHKRSVLSPPYPLQLSILAQACATLRRC